MDAKTKLEAAFLAGYAYKEAAEAIGVKNPSASTETAFEKMKKDKDEYLTRIMNPGGQVPDPSTLKPTLLQKVTEYAKANPGKAALYGAGGAAAVGAGAYGALKLVQALRDRKNKKKK